VALNSLSTTPVGKHFGLCSWMLNSSGNFV